jgi:methyl-accepting chemotaxis protein PixJ
MNSETRSDRSVITVGSTKLHINNNNNHNNPLLSFLQRHLVTTIIVSTCINVGLIGSSTWSVWQISGHLEQTIGKQDRQQDLSGKLLYLDELLTMSARMFSITGKSIWEKRYTENVPTHYKTFSELTKDVSTSKEFDAADKKLLGAEKDAFRLAKEGKLKEASALLLTDEYQENKRIYAAELGTTIAQIRTAAETEVRADRAALTTAIILTLVSLGLSVVTGMLVSLVIRSYVIDREKAQKSLEVVQTDLISLNEQLSNEAEQRVEQQRQIVSETASLHTDISHILDVVCSLEEGNLTVQAEVNERSTGLISDTLNRSIESLHRIITVVVSSADGVTNSAQSLERLALDTATQSQTQTSSIQQIENSIAEVNRLTANSLTQAIATNDAMQLAQAAVNNGQQEMNAMADGIATLEQGTEQVVQRVQSLNEFVELAAQFSKDQKRVGALTRVLALNASLLSTRAIKEQDPEQFASLANEFEAIADRVNDLASETNISLVTLEHRTSQIQTVASGLDRDISDIRQLVQKFTGEMSKSRQAFTNIQLVTDRVAIMGQEVNASGEDIVRVVGDTLTAIKSIGVIAQSTENQATITREQVQKMGELARNLLQMVEFFQLEETPDSAHPLPLPDDSTTVANPEAIYHLLKA